MGGEALMVNYFETNTLYRKTGKNMGGGGVEVFRIEKGDQTCGPQRAYLCMGPVKNITVAQPKSLCK